MAGLTTAEKNALADNETSRLGFASLHSADPGATGLNELTGGSPAYARKAISWNAASGGVANASNQPVFDVPPGSTVAFIGYWSLVSGGTFRGSSPASSSETFTGQGTYTLTAASVTVS